MNVVRVIEYVSYEAIALCKALLAHGLLAMISADLESDQFLARMSKRLKESTAAACINAYFGIIFHLCENDDKLEHKVSTFVAKSLRTSITRKYKQAK